MFAKLLKHEIKSTGGMLGILSPFALVVSLIGGFAMRGVMNPLTTAQGVESASLLAGMLLPFVFISLFAYAFGGEIYLAVQFYKRKFTDQGYLTFTLPVPTWQIYLSSLLNMMLWTLVIGFVTIVSFTGIFTIAMYDSDFWHMIRDEFTQRSMDMKQLFRQFDVLSLLCPVMAFISGNVLLITSITLGSVLAKKHKILASIGCLYLISLVINAVTVIINFVPVYNSVEPDMSMVYLASSAIYLAAGLLGSVVTIWLMDKKLNLP